MKLHVINTGFFKLDGGAMFGVVPKSIWQRNTPADENNMCSWAMRCLLIEYSDRLILIDTGIGDKQSEKFFGHYHLFGADTLEKSLRSAGFGLDEITDVFLTHLHFDHCGGAVRYDSVNDKHYPTFKNARYWSNSNHWEWATKPNPREKASFLSENILPIEASGQLNFVERAGGHFSDEIFPGFKVFFADGHTESMMLPVIQIGRKELIYCADLLPSAAHIPLPYVMGYDTRPLLTMEEKTSFLTHAANSGSILLFEHDFTNQCGRVHTTERGVQLSETATLEEMLGI